MAPAEESACNVEDLPGFDPWVGKIPWRRERLSTAVFWPGEFHGLYSPRGHKELDTTHTHTHTHTHRVFRSGSVVKNQLAMQESQEMWVWSLGGKDPLEESMATHCSFLAWRILWTEEPGRLQSMGSQRVGHDWSDLACMHAHYY